MDIVNKNHTMSWKPSLTNLTKKLITSGNFKSSIFSGFNPILKKFHEMICNVKWLQLDLNPEPLSS